MFGFSSRFSKIWSSLEGPGDGTDSPPIVSSADDGPGGGGRRPFGSQVASVLRNISSPIPLPRSTPSSPSFIHQQLHHHHSLPPHPSPLHHHHRPLHHQSSHGSTHHRGPHFSPPSSGSRFIDPVNRDMPPKRQLPSTSMSHHTHSKYTPVSGAAGLGSSPTSCDSLPYLEPSSEDPTASHIRKVHLLKGNDDPPNAGITFCGGLEVGLQGTIYISRVEENSLAEKCGLISGDQILSVNYTSFLDPGISCQEAFRMLCNDECLTLNVLPRREALSSLRRHHSYAWLDPDGRPASPPPHDRDNSGDTEMEQMQAAGALGPGAGPSRGSVRRRKHGCSRLADNEPRTVTITMEKGISLGLMIRGGLEYGLGIYVTGIDGNTLSEKAGLKVGDQILMVNNYDFRNVLHDEAVDILRSSARLTMKVRYVGKVPSSTAPLVKDLAAGGSLYNPSEASSSSLSSSSYNFTRIPSSRCSIRGPRSRHHSPGGRGSNGSSSSPVHRHQHSPRRHPSSQSNGSSSQSNRPPTLVITDNTDEELLEQRLQELLDEKEKITFAFYKNEYVTKGMTIDAFAALLLELLDTREKYNIMNNVRGVIRREDMDKFDELIFKREEQAMIKSTANPQETALFMSAEDSSDSSLCYQQEGDCNDDEDEECLDEDVDEVGVKNGNSLMSKQGTKRYLPGVPDTREEPGNSEDSGVEMVTGGSFRVSRYRRLSRSDAGAGLCVPRPSSPGSGDRGLLNPHRAVPRRHSSCASASAIGSDQGQGLGNQLTVSNPDERRWSIAAAHELPTDYPGSGYYQRDPSKARSLSGGEMRIVGAKSGPSPVGRAQMRSTSGNHLQIPGTEEPYLQPHHQQSPTPPQFLPSLHSRVRRHRSLPSPTFINPVFAPNSLSHPHRSSSFRLPHHRAQLEPGGRLRVVIKKSKPILGIAIEGGMNVTTQQQPRIISIHSSGAAFETGDLHVGHIILEVDSLTTANLSHEQVAQMIADAYYNTPHKDFIEFVVREKSKNEFDIRRSSFMLLNNSFE